MKALIRKAPYVDEDKQEVYLQPWHPWIDEETGAPLTDENYGYALCEFPEGFPEGMELGIDDFDVVEKYVTETDESGEEVRKRVLKAVVRWQLPTTE